MLGDTWKMKLRNKLLSEQPFCVFCGGKAKASTVDHLPARTFFRPRNRPQGLEFSACAPCNSGSRIDEMVASLISRAYPDAKSEAEKAELIKIVKGIRNNCPGILTELIPDREQEERAHRRMSSDPDFGGAMNAGGPLVRNILNRFAAKAGLALHYELTKEIVHETGGVCVWFYPNEALFAGNLPNDLIAMLGNPTTLRQGKKEVGDQFSYSSGVAADNNLSAHFATFRLSFAICAVVSNDFETVEKLSLENKNNVVSIFRPGFLKSTGDQNGGTPK